MARFEHHVAVSLSLGIGCGAFAATTFQLPWQEAAVATVLCTVGGIAPDIDHPQSRFAEFVFSTAALLLSVLLLSLLGKELTSFATTGLLVGLFWILRWGLRQLLQRLTVHRGMVHSLPACAIWAMGIFLLFGKSPLELRGICAASAAVGFLSHLVLDEIFAFVDSSGVRFVPKRSLGSALKLWSASRRATAATYLLGALLAWLCWKSL